MKGLVMTVGTLVVVSCTILFAITWLPHAIDMVEARHAEITAAMEQ